jgi:hypothetical protein
MAEAKKSAKPSPPPGKDLVKKPGEGEPAAPEGTVRWVLGWLVVPALVIGTIFGAGMHVGARHPEMWLSRFFLWIFGG